MQDGDQVVRRTLGDREPHVTSGLDSAHLVFALFHVALGLVVHVQAGECHGNTNGLDGVDRLSEPEDGNANNGDTFDQGSDRVSDGRGGCEDDESDDVLGKVDGPVEEEIVHDRVGSGSMFFVIASKVGVVFGGIIGGHEVGEIVVEPNGDHEDESHAGGIE